MKSIYLKDRVYSTEKCAFIMGVINATTDSFYSESRVLSVQQGVERALKMIEDGADILDLGAESSRPGSEYVLEEREIEKLVPLVSGIRKYNSTVPISVDTRKKNVIEACVQSGADILNDISALEDDENIARFCAKAKIPVILMHKRGLPRTMQDKTYYDDVVSEVQKYLYSRSDYAISQGIEERKIIFDVGIGFGKDLQANLRLVRNCGKICHGYRGGTNLGLMALSRKSMICELTGKSSQQNLYGTLAANAYSIIAGIDIVRVHDVSETAQVVNVLSGLMNE